MKIILLILLRGSDSGIMLAMLAGIVLMLAWAMRRRRGGEVAQPKAEPTKVATPEAIKAKEAAAMRGRNYSPMAELKRLEEMKKLGKISDVEYLAQRRKIMDA